MRRNAFQLLRPTRAILQEDGVGDKVAIIDTGAAVAKQLQKKLAEKDLLETAGKLADISFWTNSQAPNAAQVIEQLWGEKAEAKVL